MILIIHQNIYHTYDVSLDELLQPFGEGLVTIVVPQLRRGENSLLLWNTSNLSAPIYTFVGHTDVVLEFQWRHLKLGIVQMCAKNYSKKI